MFIDSINVFDCHLPEVSFMFCKKAGIYPFKNIFAFTTAGDLDCVERLPALHHSVDFIFLSLGIMHFIVEL